MDDIQNVGNGEYICADEIEKLSAFKQFTLSLNILAAMVPNVIIALTLAAYSVLKHVYYLMFSKSLNSIRGQLAVVTGGSNGIGREICLQLAKDGCNVAILDMDLCGAERTCHDIRQFGVTAIPYKIDVSDYNQVVAVKKAIDRDMGATDILVNNAGLMPKMSLREGKPDDIERVINVNVTSHFWMVRIFIEDMIVRRRGHIVAIASMIAFYPCGRAITYTTTKCAVKGFMEALNQEIREERYNIKTLTVFPHFINTRKEVIDYVRQLLGSDILAKVGVRSPKDVAVATVTAIRNGSKYVSVPWYYIGLGKLYAALPTSWQDISTRIILPRTIKTETKSN